VLCFRTLPAALPPVNGDFSVEEALGRPSYEKIYHYLDKDDLLRQVSETNERVAF